MYLMTSLPSENGLNPFNSAFEYLQLMARILTPRWRASDQGYISRSEDCVNSAFGCLWPRHPCTRFPPRFVGIKGTGF